MIWYLTFKVEATMTLGICEQRCIVFGIVLMITIAITASTSSPLVLKAKSSL